MLYRVHLAWIGLELTTLVVIGTDYMTDGPLIPGELFFSYIMAEQVRLCDKMMMNDLYKNNILF